MANAATQVSGLELGGLFGSLSSGAISDHLVRSNDGSKGNVGLRVQARHAPPCPHMLLPCYLGFRLAHAWPLHLSRHHRQPAEQVCWSLFAVLEPDACASC